MENGSEFVRGKKAEMEREEIRSEKRGGEETGEVATRVNRLSCALASI